MRNCGVNLRAWTTDTPIMWETQGGDKKSIRVLVIDEGGEYFQQVQDHANLNSHHYKMACRHTTEISEVADLLLSWDPTVVIIDVAHSPFCSAQVAKGCSDREVPLVVTGYIHNKEIQEAIEKIGAIAYVVKSEDPDDLDDVVQLLATVAREETAIH